MSGIHLALAGSSKPNVYAVPFTKGTSGPTEGVGDISLYFLVMGSFTGNQFIQEGRKIRAYYYNSSVVYMELYVEGNHTGTWWENISVDGTYTLVRASADVPTGSYDGTYTSWRWTGEFYSFPASGIIYIT